MLHYECCVCMVNPSHQQIFVNVLVHLLYRHLLAAAIYQKCLLILLFLWWCESANVCCIFYENGQCDKPHFYFPQTAFIVFTPLLHSPHQFESLVGGFSLRIHAQAHCVYKIRASDVVPKTANHP